MGRKIIAGGAFLGIAVLLAIIWCIGSPAKGDVGTPYLIFAAVTDLCCLVIYASLRKAEKAGYPQHIICQLQSRAQVFLILAWQLAIVGVLNICAGYLIVSVDSLVLSTGLLLMCIMISDRLVALADIPGPDGNPKPLQAFGQPRSRRLIFWALVVYPASCLMIAGLLLFLRARAYPMLFHPPQLCLLIAAVLSLGATVLILQRYRKAACGKICAAICIITTLTILTLSGIVGFSWMTSLFTYVVSSLIVICLGLNALHLLQSNGNSCSAEL